MKNSNIYAGYRYPAQIISHAVWLYHRFTLSFRDIEELLSVRGVVVSYEKIRQWCKKYVSSYCKQIKKNRG
jgi:putative transposase